MAEIGKEEPLKTLHNFQKDKIPSPGGLPIEFFLKCFDFIKVDLHRVVEATLLFGKILVAFNTTFIVRIPKMNNPVSFENFHPISLCNNIYKIIAKIISRRIKETLSKRISSEQFAFLEGCQLHEAIGVAQESLHSVKKIKNEGDDSQSRHIQGLWQIKLDLP